MRIFPVQETETDRALRGITGTPRKKALLGFLEREKEYVSVGFYDEGQLVWTLDDGVDEINLQNFWREKLMLWKAGKVRHKDQKLGRVRAIFRYKGKGDLNLDYTPQVVRGKYIEDKPRKSVPLRQNRGCLVLPSRFYLVRE